MFTNTKEFLPLNVPSNASKLANIMGASSTTRVERNFSDRASGGFARKASVTGGADKTSRESDFEEMPGSRRI